MNRISKIAVIVTAAGLIAACGNTTDTKDTRPKSRCKSVSCKGRVVEPTPVVPIETHPGENTGPAAGGGSANRPNTAPGRSANPGGPANPGGSTKPERVDPWSIRRVPGPPPQVVVVPDLTGKSEAEVRSTLAGVNLVASVTTVPTGVASNAGARSSVPQKGTTVVVGSTVTVVVAFWQPPLAVTFVTVPNVVGLSFSAAKGALGGLGLELGIQSSIVTVDGDPVRDGVCVAQTTAAGTKVRVGATVACDFGFLPPGTRSGHI